jgi:septal ring factor EnvC (AmiA/AmiB activator)
MSDTPTPRTDKWEYEQECNYEVAWEDNCRQLERELAEAMDDANAYKQMLQNLSKTHAIERAELDRSFQFLTKQRDALAEALRNYMSHHRRHGFVTFNEALDAEQALAATKGGQHE